MDLLKRPLAPILDAAWAKIDEEARRVLTLNLAGRKVVDFDGPHGFGHAAVSTGELKIFRGGPDGTHVAGIRRVQPLMEVRVPFRLDLMDLDGVGRGAHEPDLVPVQRAAELIASLEDGAIFNGDAEAGISGILPSSPHPPIPIVDARGYAAAVGAALEVLRTAGIDGPFALVLGARAYEEVSQATQDGYPLRKHLLQLVPGPIVRAPAVTGGVLLSTRGGDYTLTIGQDLSVGFAHREKHEVELYITESLTFRVIEPRAAVVLTHPR